MEKYKTKKLRLLVLLVIAFLFLSPVYHINAQEVVKNYIASTGSSLMMDAINWVRSVIGSLIGLVGSWIDYIINQPITGSVTAQGGVVRTSWELARNFANMFFIIALIIMAFATIFNVGSFRQYSFSSLIVNFLIAALLINFSLVIGEMIIDWSTSLSNIFIQAMGSVGGRIGQGARIGLQYGGNPASTTNYQAVNLTGWQESIGVVANVILMSMILFSMAVLLFFSIVRIPILWMLLIVSPLAWILYILPTTRKWNTKWWSYFISWNLFMPIYLFFIYFGVLFLNQQDRILSSPTGGISLIPGQPAGTTMQTIFFYVMIGLFLVWGAKAAMSFSQAGGAGAVAGWGWARGKALAIGASRRIPGVREVEPIYKAAGQRLAQISGASEEALKGRQSVWAARFGVKGEGLKAQKVFVDKSTATYEDLKQKLDIGGKEALDKIAKIAETGTALNPEIYAHRKILAERGQLKEELHAKTFQELVNNPYASQDFAKVAKENIKPEEMLKMIASEGDYAKGKKYDMSRTNFTPAKKELIKAIMADPKKIAEMSESQYGIALDLFGGRGTAEGRAFIKAVTDTRPDFVIEQQFEIDPTTGRYKNDDLVKNIRSKSDYADIEADPTMSRSQKDLEIKTRMYENSMKGPKDTAEYSIDIWNRPEFQRGLRAKILRLQARNPRAARQLINNLDKEITTTRNRVQKELIFDTILGRSSRSRSSRTRPPPTTPPPTTPPPTTPPPTTP